MIRVVCTIFIVGIKDLEICFSNTNLLLRKSEICFKSLAQKGEISKQTANVLYSKY